jgi:hypothetical protein
MTGAQLQRFKNEFLEYYCDMLLSAEIDQNKNLIVFVRPDLDFDETITYLTDSILDTVDFEEHLNVYVAHLAQMNLPPRHQLNL